MIVYGIGILPCQIFCKYIPPSSGPTAFGEMTPSIYAVSYDMRFPKFYFPSSQVVNWFQILQRKFLHTLSNIKHCLCFLTEVNIQRFQHPI